MPEGANHILRNQIADALEVSNKRCITAAATSLIADHYLATSREVIAHSKQQAGFDPGSGRAAGHSGRSRRTVPPYRDRRWSLRRR